MRRLKARLVEISRELQGCFYPTFPLAVDVGSTATSIKQAGHEPDRFVTQLSDRKVKRNEAANRLKTATWKHFGVRTVGGAHFPVSFMFTSKFLYVTPHSWRHTASAAG